MTNSVQKLNTAAKWTTSIVLSVIGVAMVLVIADAGVAGSTSAEAMGTTTTVMVSTTISQTSPPPHTVPPKGPEDTTPMTVPDFIPTTMPPEMPTSPNEPTQKPPTTWEALGFGGLVPLNIVQITPGMNICRVYIGNGGHTTDYIVHEVIDFQPKTPGAVQAPYVSSSFRILVERSSDMLYDDLTAYLELTYADDMGLTGDRTDEVRTFAGTCSDPISSDLVEEVPIVVLGEELPESL